jgi:hypothetical protein
LPKIAADPNHTLWKPDAEQEQAWRDAAAPLTTEWMQIMTDQGQDGEAILQGLIESLKKYDSYAG